MTYAAIITAAGLSSRMGAFKPLLDLGGMPVVCRTVSSYASAGVSDVTVVVGHRADEIRAALDHWPVAIIENPRYAESGMFESVKLGLESLGDGYEGVFVTPVDIPLVLPQTIRSLMEANASIAMPRFRGRTGHPVLLRQAALPSVFAHDGSNGLKGAFGQSGCVQLAIEVDDAGVVLDADTPEEFALLEELDAMRAR